MIFKLWHKLVLMMIGMTSIVLILALFISEKSIQTGFLAYINQVEEKRLDKVASNLIYDYKKDNSWEYIRNKKLPQSLPPPNPQTSSLPLLNELATKPGEKKQSLQPSRPPRPPFEEDKPIDDRRADGPARSDRRPDSDEDRKPSANKPPAIILLDANKQRIAGSEKKFIELSKSSNSSIKPIKYKRKEIGYIQFERFTKFTGDLDKQFIQYQHNAFAKIAFIALGIILLCAAFFATYLRSRINKIGDHARLLTSGEYSPQSLDTSKDELGQLSHKLGTLGKTLASNQEGRRRWVSDISHELRTPVAVLQGEIEAIQDGIREMNRDSVDSLYNETLRLSRLITDLHQLSLSDSGALNYEKNRLNLTKLTQNIISTRKIKFDEKNITISIEAKDKTMVYGDPQRLEQLFSNLANNSLHYTRKSGMLTIDIKQQKDTIIVEWSDSAPGVKDEELSKLFERLFRVEESRNRNAGGSGLGLTICKNIVEAHDGTITAQHSPLGGITFVITFPIDNN